MLSRMQEPSNTLARQNKAIPLPGMRPRMETEMSVSTTNPGPYEIKTKHDLDFEMSRDGSDTSGLAVFRVGTCCGQFRVADDAYEIVSVLNTESGNGHFDDMMQWFEHACRRDDKGLRFTCILNERFAFHLIEKRGFKVYTVEKEFTRERIKTDNAARRLFAKAGSIK
jgi:hypothetical protein